MTFPKWVFVVGVNCRHVNFGSSERRRGRDPVKQREEAFCICMLAGEIDPSVSDSSPLLEQTDTLWLRGANAVVIPVSELGENAPPFFPPPFLLCSVVLFPQFHR